METSILVLEFILCMAVGAIVMFAWTYRYMLDLEAENRAQQSKIRSLELIEFDRNIESSKVRQKSRAPVNLRSAS